MFKRRPRSYGQIATEMVYPRGGWTRAARYLGLRLRRLPDPPQRVARGVAAGVFVSFTPFLGLHLLLAIGLAWAVRANVFAAMIGSLIGNPVTIPVIAVTSVRLGRWMLGIETANSPAALVDSFARASAQLTRNLFAVLGDGTVEWAQLANFWHMIFVPYAVGCILPGLAAATVAHLLTVPLVEGYHRRRAARRARAAEGRPRQSPTRQPPRQPPG